MNCLLRMAFESFLSQTIEFLAFVFKGLQVLSCTVMATQSLKRSISFFFLRLAKIFPRFDRCLFIIILASLWHRQANFIRCDFLSSIILLEMKSAIFRWFYFFPQSSWEYIRVCLSQIYLQLALAGLYHFESAQALRKYASKPDFLLFNCFYSEPSSVQEI